MPTDLLFKIAKTQFLSTDSICFHEFMTLPHVHPPIPAEKKKLHLQKLKCQRTLCEMGFGVHLVVGVLEVVALDLNGNINSKIRLMGSLFTFRTKAMVFFFFYQYSSKKKKKKGSQKLSGMRQRED